MFNSIGNKKSLTEQVEEELTTAIRSGKFLPGQKIPTENELCELFGVSRTAIREAVKKLSARGIIDVKKGSGAYVSEISVQNASEVLNMFFELSSNQNLVLHTIEARQLLEPMLASRAASFRTEEHIHLLQKNLSQMQACGLNDKKREAELDNHFHRIILSTANNTVLELLLDPIFNLMPKFKAGVFAKPTKGNLIKDKEIMLEHHQKIADAIINTKAEDAFSAMSDHLVETRSNYIKSLEMSEV